MTNNTLTIERYTCDICGDVYDNKKDAIKCEKDCKLHNIQFEEVEEIRLKSKSVEELLQLCNNYLEKYFGIKIEYKSYPNKIRYEGITHSAPIGVKTSWDDKSRNYLAFCGRFDGNVINLFSNKKKIDLSDCFGTFSRGKLRFLHTGSGCSGQEFSISGHLFLQDFPLIEEQYNEYILLKNKHEKYSSLCKDKAIDFSVSVQTQIYEDEDIKEIVNVQKELESKLSTIDEYLKNTIEEKRSIYEPKSLHLLVVEKDYDEEQFQKLRTIFK